MMRTLDQVCVLGWRDRMGEQLLAAALLGDDELMKIASSMGAARRHVVRVETGQLTVTEGLRREVDQVLDGTSRMLDELYAKANGE